MRSLGIESILRLEDLDLVPEQFPNRSVESQAKYRLIASDQQSAYCRVFCISFFVLYWCVHKSRSTPKLYIKSAHTGLCPAPLVCHIAVIFMFHF